MALIDRRTLPGVPPAEPLSWWDSVFAWWVALPIANWSTVSLFLILAVLVLAWAYLRRRSKKRWYFWPLPLIVIPLVLAVAAWTNLHFGLYNTLGDMFDEYTFPTGDASLMQDPTGQHPQGVTVEALIPSPNSGVGTYPALVWLPPQYFSAPRGTDFPVVYLYHGTPGDATQWFLGGNAYAAGLASARQGYPAVLVSPTVIGSEFEDTECVNGSQGNWQTYIAEDVPDFMQANAHVLAGPNAQAVAGFSSGGYCAQIAALRQPDQFRIFGNFSGDTMPTYDLGMAALFGNVADLQGTVDSYTSDWVIQNQPRSRKVTSWLGIGSQDEATIIADEQQYVALAKSLGMDATFYQAPGVHSFYFWAATLLVWLPVALNQMAAPTATPAEPPQIPGQSGEPDPPDPPAPPPALP